MYLSKEQEENYLQTIRGKRKCEQQSNGVIKVEIIGDSHVRGLNACLLRICGKNLQPRATFTPGATASIVTTNLNRITSYLGPKDYLVFIAGTNDIEIINANQASFAIDMKALKAVLSQSLQTNVIIVTVPFRYDINVNEKIKEYNRQLKSVFEAEKENCYFPDRIHLLEINEVVSRNNFTGHGLHLNQLGKELIAEEVLKLVSPTDQFFQVRKHRKPNQ